MLKFFYHLTAVYVLHIPYTSIMSILTTITIGPIIFWNKCSYGLCRSNIPIQKNMVYMYNRWLLCFFNSLYMELGFLKTPFCVNRLLTLTKYIKFCVLWLRYTNSNFNLFISKHSKERYFNYHTFLYVEMFRFFKFSDTLLGSLNLSFVNRQHVVTHSLCLQGFKNSNNCVTSSMRLSRFFNKTKFSRNRQVVFSIVQFGLFVNVLFIFLSGSMYYQILPNLSYFNLQIMFILFIQSGLLLSLLLRTSDYGLVSLIYPITAVFRL